MENIETIKCKYHPDNLNQSWCSNCGSPICGKCIAEMPGWLMGFGYPDICPYCKQKKINFNFKISLIIFSVPIFISFVFLSYQLVDVIIFFAMVICAFGPFLYLIITFLKERKKYHLWTITIEERSISNEELLHLIQNQQLKPCFYHKRMPSINDCEECGKNICINCSVTFYQAMGAHFSCIECYWKKRKRVTKIFLNFFGIGFSIFIGILLTVTFAYWGRIPSSFYIAYSLVSLFYGVIFTLLYLYYTKIKKKYIKWKKELAVENSNHLI